MAVLKIHQSHDKFFKASLADPKVVYDFLMLHLPDDVKNHLDITSIEHCKTDFLSAELEPSYSDVLLKVKIKGVETYIYILAEHQTCIDEFILLRLWQYMIAIWFQHIKSCGSKDALPLPAIYPLVFYTGSKEYHAARSIWELCGEQASFMKEVVTSPFHFIQVEKIPKQKLISNPWAGTFTYILCESFKKDFTKNLKEIMINFNTIAKEDHWQYLIAIVTYILNINADEANMADIEKMMHEKLLPEVEENIMTIAEQLRQEGHFRGRFEGILEGERKGKLEEKLAVARAALREGASLDFVAKITQLSRGQIQALKEEIVVH